MGSNQATFDEDYQIRVLDVDIYNSSKSLKDECSDYKAKMEDLHSMAGNYINTINKWASIIEKDKLQAIGARIRLSTIDEEKAKQYNKLKIQYDEKQLLLEKLLAEEASLVYVKAEQDATISKLSDSRYGDY